jgi:hypothetical protein
MKVHEVWSIRNDDTDSACMVRIIAKRIVGPHWKGKEIYPNPGDEWYVHPNDKNSYLVDISDCRLGVFLW